MKHNIKKILTGCLVLAVLLLAGCAAEQTPYERNDAENFSVSVKFDANGGIFTTNTSVIVDSYNLSQLKTDGNGQAQIALIPTDHEARGNDAFTPVKNGYFLAGWYKTYDPATNTYADKWDFETDRVSVDPKGSYSASQPVLTLYAAWLPMFQVDFVELETGEQLGSYTFDPTADAALQVPRWNEETGAIQMFKFPNRDGYTFQGAYYDAAGTQPVNTETLEHSGTIDYATGTTNDHTMTVYTTWTEGEWFHIYNAAQFLDHASVNGSYVLHADLDFAGEIWPTSLMYGGFNGAIEGNGHTLRNIELAQTNNSKVNAGLFGRLAESAVLKDLTLENVTFTIQSGTRVAGTSYGLLAGAIADTATVSNVQIASGKIQIDSRCYFGVDDYAIGLVCGMGDHTLVDGSGITCEATGDSPEKVQITVDGNAVSVSFVE